MIEKIKSGSPVKYKNDPEKKLFNMRQLLYYRKTNNLISEEEYKKMILEYKIKFYEHKINILKKELEEKEE